MNTYKIFIILFLMLGSKTVKAQMDDNRELLSFGLKAGLNMSNVWDTQGQDFVADPKYGLAGGAFVSLPIGTYLGIQPELIISQKGFQGSGSLLGFSYSNTRTTTFLDVPLLVQFKPIEYFTILAGPQFSYLRRKMCTLLDPIVPHRNKHSTTKTLEITLWDLSLVQISISICLLSLHALLGISKQTTKIASQLLLVIKISCCN